MSPASPPSSPRSPSRGGITGLYRALFRHARGRRHHVATFVGMLLVAQLIRLLIPYFFGAAVNALQENGVQDVRRAGMYMAWIVVAAVVAWALHGPGRVLERTT